MIDDKPEFDQKREYTLVLPDYVQYRLNLLDEILLCNSPVAVAASCGIADMVNRLGIRMVNAPLVLRLLETNNPYVVDALVGSRSPFLVLRNITPNAMLLRDSFKILSSHNPGSLYPPVLMGVLGFIDIAYKVSVDGFSLYPFSMTELSNIGKYLDETVDQFTEPNTVILRILEDIYQMGMLTTEWKNRFLAFQAMQIRMAYFDQKKDLSVVIPEELLTRLPPSPSIKPEFVKSRH